MSRTTDERQDLGLAPTRAQCPPAPVTSSATSPPAAIQGTGPIEPQPGSVPDAQLQYIQQRTTSHQWFLFTLVFKDSSFSPNPSKFLDFFDNNSYVRYRIVKMIGWSHGDPIMFIREYECGLVASMGNLNAPHHIHCILGIPKGSNISRLLRKYKRELIAPNSRFLASVDLQPLSTSVDIERAHRYIRKRKPVHV
jgi:hypothetical protein